MNNEEEDEDEDEQALDEDNEAQVVMARASPNVAGRMGNGLGVAED